MKGSAARPGALFERRTQVEGAVVVVILEPVVAHRNHLAQAAGEDP
jgi:hypothetical protein